MVQSLPWTTNPNIYYENSRKILYNSFYESWCNQINKEYKKILL